MLKDKETYFGIFSIKGSEVQEEIINSDEINYQINQDVSITDKTPLAGLHIFGISDKNPSGLSPNSYVIIAAELNYPSDNPYCGLGGNNKMSRCSFFVKKSSGEIVKVAEWPSADLIEKYPNFYNGDTFSFIYNDNAITFADKDTVYFKSRFSLQCSGQAKQSWQFNLLSHQFKYFGQEGKPLVNNCD